MPARPVPYQIMVTRRYQNHTSSKSEGRALARRSKPRLSMLSVPAPTRKSAPTADSHKPIHRQNRIKPARRGPITTYNRPTHRIHLPGRIPRSTRRLSARILAASISHSSNPFQGLSARSE